MLNKIICQNMSIRHEISRETDTSINLYLKIADEYAQKLLRSTPDGLTLANLTCGLCGHR